MKGELCIDDLKVHMISEEFFLPELIGIPSLSPECRSDLDHDFHEVHSIEPSPPAPYAFTSEELIGRMRERNKDEWLH